MKGGSGSVVPDSWPNPGPSPQATRRRRLMFLCSGNSCRSQMAEGFARHMAGDRWEVFSAGLEPKGIHPRAIAVMREVGIDISCQTSDPIDAQLLRSTDVIITLCGDAEERCPATPPSVLRLHWPLEDPARAQGTEAEVMEVFRRVRDEIQARVASFLGSGGKPMTGR